MLALHHGKVPHKMGLEVFAVALHAHGAEKDSPMFQCLVHPHVFQKAIQMELDRFVLELFPHGVQVQEQRGVASAQNNAKGLLHLLIPGQRSRLEADISLSKILEEIG